MPRGSSRGIALENIQVLRLALTIHHVTRNKMLMDLFSAHDYCIPYGRTLLLETALANAVVQNTREFQGLYVPPFLKKGSFVFFAMVRKQTFQRTLLTGKEPCMERLLLYTRRQSFLENKLHHP